MAADDAGDDIGDVGLGVDLIELGGLDQRGEDGPVVGAARAFLRVSARNRMARSTALLSISIRPSARTRVGPAQRDRE